MHKRLFVGALALLVAPVACASIANIFPFGASDAGADAGSDAAPDAHADAGGDARDAGADTSTVVVPYDATVPPAAVVSAGVTGTGRIHAFAIRRLYVGDSSSTPAFRPDPNAWQALGYDLDRLDTTSESATNTCAPYNAGSGVTDGVGGIDNAFGGKVIGTASLLYTTLEVAATQGTNLTADAGLSSLLSSQIAAGSFTSVIDTEGLDRSVQDQTAIGLNGRLFAGGPYGGTPPLQPQPDGGPLASTFALTASWPINPISLVDAGLDASPSQFTNAYVTQGAFVSGALDSVPPVTVTLALVIDGTPVTFTIHHAVVSFTYSVDANGQGHATHGTLAGVLRTKELLAGLAKPIANVSNGEFCGVFKGLVEGTILSAQDLILSDTDAISNTPGTPCNAISLGLGFDADEIQLPSQVSPPLDAGNAPPCAYDAGAD